MPYYQMPFDFMDYLCKALLLKNVGIAHTWYIPMILGMYLFLPLVSMVLDKIPGKLLFPLLTVVYLYLFVVPSISVFQSALGVPSAQMLAARIDLSFSGNHYGFYLVLGYVLSTLCINHPQCSKREQRD